MPDICYRIFRHNMDAAEPENLHSALNQGLLMNKEPLQATKEKLMQLANVVLQIASLLADPLSHHQLADCATKQIHRQSCAV